MTTSTLTGYANRVLNRAERMPLLIPAAAVFLGSGIDQLLQGHGLGWCLLGPGLLLTAIRPAGTGLRRTLRIRALRREVADLRRHIGTAP
jgi:hypothetical protein